MSVSAGILGAARWESASYQPVDECIAEEVPVALEYNGISHAVMLATPADLEDFALGFSLSEGILVHPRELRDVELDESARGIRLAMEIASERFVLLKDRRRNLAGRTGCGLCGTESLEQVFRALPRVPEGPGLAVERLHDALRKLAEIQTLQQRTGGVHAAFWLDDDHAALREDVGRHNALDKLIGHLARRGTDFAAGAAIITSRASSEMVQKAAALGIPILAAVSAPTLQAVRLAEALDMTLIGFARGDHHVVYSHPRRLKG
jgi:FdhD protein